MYLIRKRHAGGQGSRDERQVQMQYLRLKIRISKVYRGSPSLSHLIAVGRSVVFCEEGPVSERKGECVSKHGR